MSLGLLVATFLFGVAVGAALLFLVAVVWNLEPSNGDPDAYRRSPHG